jgi:hypothetical protein
VTVDPLVEFVRRRPSEARAALYCAVGLLGLGLLALLVGQ